MLPFSMSLLRVGKLVPPFCFHIRGSYKLNTTYLTQRVAFGSKKEKEKVDKEKKKLRKLLKISNISEEISEGEDERSTRDYTSENHSNEKRKEKNKIDYNDYNLKMKEIISGFENKLKKMLDSSLSVEAFNNINITKDRQNYKFSDIAQVVIKSKTLIYIYPYTKSDTQKIIHSLKLKDNMWNPRISDNSEYIHLQLPPVTEEMKMKKRKETKDLLEKVKNDVRNVRHKIREHISKYIEGDEWKIVERNKLDSYIKEKIKNLDVIYEAALKKY